MEVIYMHSVQKPASQEDLINVLSENVAATGEMFSKFFLVVQEHFIAYCRCRKAVLSSNFLL
jgi:hypothetical protein